MEFDSAGTIEMTKIISDPSVLNDKEINLVDMHHHSTVSDGAVKPEILAKVYKKNNKGLCLADHNQIKGAIYLSKQKGLFSIPAVEITSKEAKDVLAYFYNIKDLTNFWEREIKNNIRNNAGFNLNRTTVPVADLPDKIKKYSGIPMLAHPYAMKPKYSFDYLLNKNFIKRIEGIELFTFESIKPKQLEILKRFNKPAVAGSDSHTSISFDIFTGSHCFDINSFLDSIIKKKNFIYYKDMGKLKRIAQKWVVFKNNVYLKAPSNI